MPAFESIANDAALDIIVPDSSLGFPAEETDALAWLTRLKSDTVERKLAYFGRLDFSTKASFSIIDAR
jgi:hypothetical protein